MSALNSAYRSALVIWGTVVLCLLILLTILLKLWALRVEYDRQVDNLRPRLERLEGLAMAEGELRESAARIDDTLLELAYPVSADAAVTATKMQQRVRELMTRAGMSVVGSQILPPMDEQELQILRLELNLAGDIVALDQALRALRELRPLAIIDGATIKPTRARRSRSGEAPAPQQLTARLRIISLRVPS